MLVLKKIFHLVFVSAIFLYIFAGCARVPKPSVPVVPGREVDTIQSAVSLSIKAGEINRSARGFLVFKRPDRFHLAILGPFGMTLLEVYSAADRLTCVIPSRETACTGSFEELPAGSGLQSWQIMKWAVEQEPLTGPVAAGRHERVSEAGARETLIYDDRGLLVGKESPYGDVLTYSEYHNINGSAFPTHIEYRNAHGVHLKVAFQDPEINLPIDDAALTPNLSDLKILPLPACGGFTP